MAKVYRISQDANFCIPDIENGKVLMNINSTFAHEPCAIAQSPIGIDKLTLTTKDFRIADANQSKLKIVPHTIDLADANQEHGLLFIDNMEQAISGTKAFYNHELFGLDINSKGLRITANPSKPYHPYNTCNTTQQLKNRSDEIFRIIYNDMGIDANFEQMNVSRLDITRTEAMKHNCIAYQPILHSLKIPRATQQKIYPDGYMTSNKQTSLVCYNKGAEIRQDKARLFWKESHPEIENDNLMRMEFQAKTTEAVIRHFGIKKLGDVYRSDIIHLQSNYIRKLEIDIFKTSTISEQTSFSFDNHADKVSILKALKKQYPSGFMAMFYRLHDFNIDADFSKTEAVLLDAGLHRNTILKHRNKFFELRNMATFIHNKTSQSLYAELVLKFAS